VRSMVQGVQISAPASGYARAIEVAEAIPLERPLGENEASLASL
jgi:hypothetical protein